MEVGELDPQQAGASRCACAIGHIRMSRIDTSTILSDRGTVRGVPIGGAGHVDVVESLWMPCLTGEPLGRIDSQSAVRLVPKAQGFEAVVFG